MAEPSSISFCSLRSRHSLSDSVGTDIALVTLLPTQANKRRVIRKLLGQNASTNPAWAEYMLVAMQTRTKLGRPTGFTDDDLSRTRVPTLLLIGEQEVVYADTQATIDPAKRLMPRIEAEIIPGAGHILSADQPERVDARILRFLNRP